MEGQDSFHMGVIRAILADINRLNTSRELRQFTDAISDDSHENKVPISANLLLLLFHPDLAIRQWSLGKAVMRLNESLKPMSITQLEDVLNSVLNTIEPVILGETSRRAFYATSDVLLWQGLDHVLQVFPEEVLATVLPVYPEIIDRLLTLTEYENVLFIPMLSCTKSLAINLGAKLWLEDITEVTIAQLCSHVLRESIDADNRTRPICMDTIEAVLIALVPFSEKHGEDISEILAQILEMVTALDAKADARTVLCCSLFRVISTIYDNLCQDLKELWIPMETVRLYEEILVYYFRTAGEIRRIALEAANAILTADYKALTKAIEESDDQSSAVSLFEHNTVRAGMLDVPISLQSVDAHFQMWMIFAYAGLSSESPHPSLVRSIERIEAMRKEYEIKQAPAEKSEVTLLKKLMDCTDVHGSLFYLLCTSRRNGTHASRFEKIFLNVCCCPLQWAIDRLTTTPPRKYIDGLNRLSACYRSSSQLERNHEAICHMIRVSMISISSMPNKKHGSYAAEGIAIFLCSIINMLSIERIDDDRDSVHLDILATLYILIHMPEVASFLLGDSCKPLWFGVISTAPPKWWSCHCRRIRSMIMRKLALIGAVKNDGDIDKACCHDKLIDEYLHGSYNWRDERERARATAVTTTEPERPATVDTEPPKMDADELCDDELSEIDGAEGDDEPSEMDADKFGDDQPFKMDGTVGDDEPSEMDATKDDEQTQIDAKEFGDNEPDSLCQSQYTTLQGPGIEPLQIKVVPRLHRESSQNLDMSDSEDEEDSQHSVHEVADNDAGVCGKTDSMDGSVREHAIVPSCEDTNAPMSIDREYIDIDAATTYADKDADEIIDIESDDSIELESYFEITAPCIDLCNSSDDEQEQNRNQGDAPEVECITPVSDQNRRGTEKKKRVFPVSFGGLDRFLPENIRQRDKEKQAEMPKYATSVTEPSASRLYPGMKPKTARRPAAIYVPPTRPRPRRQVKLGPISTLPLYKDVLCIDVDDPQRTSYLDANRQATVPASFDHMERFVESFQPFLLEEIRANVMEQVEIFGELSEHSAKRKWMQLKIVKRAHKDCFKLVHAKARVKKDYDIRKDDMVIASTSAKMDGNHALAIVAESPRNLGAIGPDGFQDILIVLMIRSDVLPGYQLDRNLGLAQFVFIIPVLKMITFIREYVALQSLIAYPLADLILASGDPPKEQSHKDLHSRAPEVLNPPFLEYIQSKCNRDQLSAIYRALPAESDVDSPQIILIKGPPGTGKTRTLLAILNTLLQTKDESSPPPLKTSPKSSGTRTARRGQMLPPKSTNRNVGSMASAHDRTANAPRIPKYRERRRILVCTPSNAAIDEIVYRLITEPMCNSSLDSYKPSVIRLGAPSSITNNDIKKVCLCHMISRSQRTATLQLSPEDEAKLKELASECSLFRKMEVSESASEEEQMLARTKRCQVEKKIDRIKAENSCRPENARQLTKRLLLDADIVCSTLNTAGSDDLANLGATFDTVIIDEAAQAVELSSLIPLQYGCRTCILVGDPHQLPATVRSTVASDMLYERSLFERLEHCGYPVILLREQYRMHPSICRFPSDHFYEGQLIDALPLEHFEKPYHMYDLLSPFRFFDVSSSESQGKSKSNQIEAEFVADLYKFALEKGAPHISPSAVGIITPYRNQVSVIQSEIRKKRITVPECICSVDAIQGKEKDIIIFSCVRAHSEAGKGIGFLKDIRRMNVALTRAKYSLLVVGCSSSLKRNRHWADLISYAKKSNNYICVSQEERRVLFHSNDRTILQKRKVEETAPIDPRQKRTKREDIVDQRTLKTRELPPDKRSTKNRYWDDSAMKQGTVIATTQEDDSTRSRRLDAKINAIRGTRKVSRNKPTRSRGAPVLSDNLLSSRRHSARRPHTPSSSFTSDVPPSLSNPALAKQPNPPLSNSRSTPSLVNASRSETLPSPISKRRSTSPKRDRITTESTASSTHSHSTTFSFQLKQSARASAISRSDREPSSSALSRRSVSPISRYTSSSSSHSSLRTSSDRASTSISKNSLSHSHRSSPPRSLNRSRGRGRGGGGGRGRGRGSTTTLTRGAYGTILRRSTQRDMPPPSIRYRVGTNQKRDAQDKEQESSEQAPLRDRMKKAQARRTVQML